MLGIVGFVLYLIIFYKALIIENHISSGYNTFSNMTMLLIILQLYLVHNATMNFKSVEEIKLSKVTTGILYLISILTLGCSLIMYTILKYFSTDGFRPIVI